MDEDGQSFESFLSSFRNVPGKGHSVLYIQPCDGVSDESLLKLLSSFERVHFPGVKVAVRKPMRLSEVKGVESRTVEGVGKQYLATAVITALAAYFRSPKQPVESYQRTHMRSWL